MRKKFSQKLQWQYFASYLALMLVIMGVFYTFSYNSFHQYHARIVMDNYHNRLGLIRGEQEDVLDDVVAIAGQIMDVSSVVPFQYSEEPDKALKLIDQMTAYRSTHDAIAGIYLHFYDDQFVYSSSGLYTLDRFVSNAVIFSDCTADALRSLLEDTQQLTVLPMQSLKGYSFQTVSRPRNMVPLFVPVSISTGLRCGTAMFLIEDVTYKDWFTNLGSEDVDIYILHGSEVIAAQNMTGVPLENVLEASANAAPSLAYEKEDYHLIELPGNTFGFRYVMLLPDSMLQVGMNAPVQMLTILSALVGALGILFIHYFVQRRMQPIKLLHSMISERDPSGNELLEIRDGIQRLIDQNNAMTSIIENVESLRKSDFVRRFLVGFDSEDEYLSMAEACALNVDTRYYVVAMIAKPADSTYELTAEKINHLFDGQVYGAARTLTSNRRMVLVAFADEIDLLMEFLENKFTGIRACCTGVTMAVSAVHSDYREGQRAYLEAENAFELRFIRGNTQVIRFDALPESHAGGGVYSRQMVERLRAGLHAGDAARVSAALKEITGSMQHMNTTLFGFRCMYNDILNVVSREAQQSGVSEEAVYDLFKLSQCLSVEDLDTLLHQVCSRVLAERTQPAPAPIPENMLLARDIIERRFSEPELSVRDIAQELSMSDSKLSVEFKKAYRMTPLECITAARMQRARRLLSTTNMPVKDIALECGYYDISGFNRRFKAYTGMTPQQYKTTSSEDAAADQTHEEETP
ncbi:MAG: helix-turn-helix domain-containing protein [Clostridia bacterium]|nr:helix-turn-helix domain-containing protein [Clostridia bacterium]